MSSIQLYDVDKYKNYREFLDETHFKNLSYSAFFILIPTLLSIYKNTLDHFIIIGSTFVTSILRWCNPSNNFFMILDHTYVKIVFLINCIYLPVSFNGKNDIYIYLCICSLLSILIFYVLACIAFNYENNLNIPLHMIVHAYTTFGFILTVLHYKSFYKFIN